MPLIARHLRQCSGQAAPGRIAAHNKGGVPHLCLISGIIIHRPIGDMIGRIFRRERIERRGNGPAMYRRHARQKFPVDVGCRIDIAAAMPE